MNKEMIVELMESIKTRKKKRKPLFGVGVNDSVFTTNMNIDGVKIMHPSYMTWKSMIKRCYSQKYQEKRTHYKGCIVCDEWLLFSNFHSWWKENHVNGWHIDKDLLVTGNKIYHPEGCIYIPPKLNIFTIDCRAARGPYPIGCSFDSQKGRFISSVNENGRRIRLGRFLDPMSAHMAWYKKKIEIAVSYKGMCDSIDPRLYRGLIGKIESMRCF